MIPSRTNSPPAEVSTKGDRVRVMVFNATFNNISVIVWRSVLLVEETGVPEENGVSALIWFIAYINY
jgi:hypothetical protein